MASIFEQTRNQIGLPHKLGNRLGFEDQFWRYVEKHPEEQGGSDPSGFLSLQVCGSDREIGDLMDGILQLVQGFGSDAPEGGRRCRSIGIIIFPPTEERRSSFFEKFQRMAVYGSDSV